MMMIRRYAIREMSKEGLMIRPIANNWSEGILGEYLFREKKYPEEQWFETRKEAEQAIYDFFWLMSTNETDAFYAPRFTVIEVFGYEKG